MKHILMGLLFLLLITAVGCAQSPESAAVDPYDGQTAAGGTATTPATKAPATTAQATDRLTATAPVVQEAPSPTAGATPPKADLPAWMTTPLRDVHTGEVFTVAQLTAQGKPILFQLMAVW